MTKKAGARPSTVNIVFSTDFPHPDCKYPRAVARFLELPVPNAAKRAILWDNCARYYGLT